MHRLAAAGFGLGSRGWRARALPLCQGGVSLSASVGALNVYIRIQEIALRAPGLPSGRQLRGIVYAVA